MPTATASRLLQLRKAAAAVAVAVAVPRFCARAMLRLDGLSLPSQSEALSGDQGFLSYYFRF